MTRGDVRGPVWVAVGRGRCLERGASLQQQAAAQWGGGGVLDVADNGGRPGRHRGGSGGGRWGGHPGCQTC